MKRETRVAECRLRITNPELTAEHAPSPVEIASSQSSSQRQGVWGSAENAEKNDEGRALGNSGIGIPQSALT
jgi:hypothetical protein